jgi:hypothetical protein
MIEVSRVVGSYLRTAWENDVYRAYFDGHESGSRHAWSFAINGRPTLFAVHRLRSLSASVVIPSMFGSLGFPGAFGYRRPASLAAAFMLPV